MGHYTRNFPYKIQVCIICILKRTLILLLCTIDRTTCTGICSGAARIGAITGIILGELKSFHQSPAVVILAGIFCVISAIFSKVLPDMTKEKMPKNLNDIKKLELETKEEKREAPKENENSTQLNNNVV